MQHVSAAFARQFSLFYIFFCCSFNLIIFDSTMFFFMSTKESNCQITYGTNVEKAFFFLIFWVYVLHLFVSCFTPQKKEPHWWQCQKCFLRDKDINRNANKVEILLKTAINTTIWIFEQRIFLPIPIVF